MPIDRDEILKRAEKLLRQGRLDAAIVEYVRVIDEHPRDWATANALGDAYVRVAQPEKAAAQFRRIADHLAAEGFLPRAAAVYKKILRTGADDEHALLQLGDIAARQGLVGDAKQHLGVVADRRRARGDRRGVAEVLVRLAAVDPSDVDIQLRAGRAAAEAGDPGTAARLLRDAASELEAEGRDDEACAALGEALRLSPDDAALRERVVRTLIARGQPARARELAATPDEWLAMAEAFDAAGNVEAATEARVAAARLLPDDAGLRTHVVRTLAARGRLAELASLLTPESAGDDPDLLRAYASVQIEIGEIDAGRDALDRALRLAPHLRDEVVATACDRAAHDPAAAFVYVDVVTDAWVRERGYPAAAAALAAFTGRAPGHLAALMKLVEVCVDGGLEEMMLQAQAQLADAYLAGGRAVEARFLAEDLVAREPWAHANLDRFRRALAALGEPDPDRIIAERLSGTSPFVTTAAPAGDLDEALGLDGDDASRAPGPITGPATAPIHGSEIDDRGPEAEAIEIDLSDLLQDLDGPAQPPASPPPGRVAPSPATLAAVFESFREQGAGHAQAGDAAEQQARGVRLLEDGEFARAVQALESAARAPQVRFSAASRLGRAWLARGEAARGIEWLELAADAPAASADEHRALLYDLGDALERIGEAARALAVFLELGVDAPSYRDVPARVAGLRTRAGG